MTRWTGRETNQGTWWGVPGTGKVLTLTGVTFSRVNSEGKVVEEWIQGNELSVLLQIGAIQVSSLAPVSV